MVSGALFCETSRSWKLSSTMPKFAEHKVLLEGEGIKITTKGITTPHADYSFKDIKSADQRIAKPLWGPVLLALLGTLILAIALQTGLWLDFLISALLLGFGFFWWLRGTRYVLTLRLLDKEEDVWYSRRSRPAVDALEAVREQLKKRR